MDDNSSKDPETIGAATHVPILALTKREVCQALRLSETSLWRLEKLGAIVAIPGIKPKLYSIDELRRFVATGVQR